MLITFALLGKYLESLAKGKTSDAIKKLVELTPATTLLVVKDKGPKLPFKSLLIVPTNVDGVGASATKGPHSSTRELPDADSIQSSPVTHVGKRFANIDGCEVAATKETKIVYNQCTT
ncbi:copper-transporting ATPase RAN1 [Trifolium repens]|nr:copper-transporting ATPase RAN1 [Trifolium repens]